MHHPVVGGIAAFGVLEGIYQGFHLAIRVESNKPTEPPIIFRTIITLEAPSGKKFVKIASRSFAQQTHRLVIEPSIITFEPRAVRRAGSMSYQFFVITDRALLRSLIDGVCDLGKQCMAST